MAFLFLRHAFMENLAPVLTHRTLLKIDKDYEAAASVANLQYVSDREEGIRRIRRGRGYCYTYRGRSVRDKSTLERIRTLAVPPAWRNVWICALPDGHIQATGIDAMGRKQYRYHKRWSALQHETKFHRVIEFGKVLPLLRETVRKDLNLPGLPERKVLAMVISLMERTLIRVGNEEYEKLYGSYGLTTLKNNHVNIRGDRITFSFKGKKGVYHRVLLRSKKFARIVRQCKAIPGKELFQYLDASGEPRKVDSGQVNQYLKDCLPLEFTTKDLRTWAGTLAMLECLAALPPCGCRADYQKNITAAFQEVSRKLGNTIAVCRKYYVHPELVRMYHDDDLLPLLASENEDTPETAGLHPEEKILMRILRRVEKARVQLE